MTKTIPRANPHLSTAQVADIKGIHSTTVTRWVAAGKITPTARTITGHARWDIDDFERQVTAMPSRPDGLVTTAAVADYVGVHAATVALWVSSGRLTPTSRTPGGHARWTLADFETQLAKLPSYLTTRQVADHVGVHPGTVTRWMSAGKITPSKRTASGQARWLLEDFEAQVAELHKVRGHDGHGGDHEHGDG